MGGIREKIVFFLEFHWGFINNYSPRFVVDGRIKYPIDDKLLQIYGSLFNDSKTFIYVKNLVIFEFFLSFF